MAGSSAYPAAFDTDAVILKPDNWFDDTDAGDDSQTVGGIPHQVGDLVQWLQDMGAITKAMQREMGLNPSGSFADITARFNLLTTVNKTANQTLTSTTGVAVTDLAFPVVSGGDYYAEFFMMWSSNAAGVVPHFAATYPTFTNAITFSENMGIVAPLTGSSDAVWDQVQTASGTYHAGFVGGTNLPAANAFSCTRFTVILANLTASGTLAINCKSEAAATQTIYKGSKGLLITN